ncbi:MAG: hypothetical protein J6P98_04135 [Clostridia bacterium]|nr:hypothetical protein [Clostridia bacterium]
MNKQTFIDAVGDIAPEYVEEAAPRAKRKRFSWAIPAAAAAVLLIGCGLILPKILNPGPDSAHTAALGTEYPADTAIAPTEAADTDGHSDGLDPEASNAEGVDSEGVDEASYGKYLAAEPEERDYAVCPNFEGESADYCRLLSAWEDASWKRRSAGKKAESIYVFSLELMRELASEAGNANAVCSPENVWLALAMLSECTGGETRAELLSALGQSDMASLRKNVKALFAADCCEDGITASVLANSVWLNKKYGFNSETLSHLAEDHGAWAFWGDPSDSAYSEALRGWLNEHTGGLLKDSVKNIELDPQTLIALASTVYFKGAWGESFPRSATDTGIFHSPEGDIEVDMMHKETESAAYYSLNGLTAVREEIDSAGNAVWYLLPNEGVSVSEMLASSETAELLNGAKRGKVVPIAMTVPKYDVNSDTDLIPALERMGVESCFGPGADFTPLTDEEVFVSSVRHAARVKADEEGVEAAAYTLIIAPTSAEAPDPVVPIEFTLDRPYAFVITGVSGAPLFMGVVNDPAGN